MAICWLASYPKSGNTWVRVFLANVLSDAGPRGLDDVARLPNAAWRRTFDEFCGVDSADLRVEEMEAMRPLVFEAMARATDGDLFLKTHDRFRHLPDGGSLFPHAVSRGVVYLVRNPLDVACSYAYHRGTDVDEAITVMSDEYHCLGTPTAPLQNALLQRLGSWSAHVQSWLDDCPLPLVRVRYEDLLRDPEATFRTLVHFVGLQTDDERIRRAVQASAFEALREQERTGRFREGSMHAPRFFRRGAAGAWKDEMTEAQVARVVADHGSVMRRLGYLDDAGEPQV